MRILTVASVALLAAFGSADVAYASQRADTTFSVERGTVLDVSVVVPSKITVRGWDRDAMEVRTDGEMSGIDISHSSRMVRVERRADRRQRGNNGVIEIRAPRGTRVVISSRQGDVQVLDVGGNVDASVITGNVTVRGGTERTTVSVASGDVLVANVDGPVRVESISGSITLDDVRGDVQLSGTSSRISLQHVRAVRAEVEVVSGNIAFDGPLAANGRYQFTTHSGEVHLYVEDNARGTLEVQSFNGELHTTVPVTPISDSGRPTPQSLAQERNSASLVGRPQRFEFGGGGSAQIVVSTFTGAVHLDRGPRR